MNKYNVVYYVHQNVDFTKYINRVESELTYDKFVASINSLVTSKKFILAGAGTLINTSYITHVHVYAKGESE